MAGTRMKTAIAKDMMRAMSRPSYWSRTRAMVTTRGAATPMPWSTRPASIDSKVGANTDTMQPAMNIARPAQMAGFRPMQSESGPKRS